MTNLNFHRTWPNHEIYSTKCLAIETNLGKIKFFYYLISKVNANCCTLAVVSTVKLPLKYYSTRVMQANPKPQLF